MSTDGPEVRVETDGAVGRVTLAAPDRLNALDPAMLEVLARGVRDLDADPVVRVIVLAGEGRAFSAGADLGDVGVSGTGDQSGGEANGIGDQSGDGANGIGNQSGGGATRTGNQSGEHPLDGTLVGVGEVVRAVVGARTPVLALVPGVAAGAGLSIALAADYCLVADDATLVLAFGALGLMPDGGATAVVAASIGRARALRLALTGEKLTGAQAAEWGLVAESVAAERFPGRAAELTDLLAALAPQGTARTTAAVNDATLDLEAALAREESGQAELIRTDDFAEGAAAFREKRRPVFGR